MYEYVQEKIIDENDGFLSTAKARKIIKYKHWRRRPDCLVCKVIDVRIKAKKWCWEMGDWKNGPYQTMVCRSYDRKDNRSWAATAPLFILSYNAGVHKPGWNNSSHQMDQTTQRGIGCCKNQSASAWSLELFVITLVLDESATPPLPSAHIYQREKRITNELWPMYSFSFMRIICLLGISRYQSVGVGD